MSRHRRHRAVNLVFGLNSILGRGAVAVLLEPEQLHFRDQNRVEAKYGPTNAAYDAERVNNALQETNPGRDSRIVCQASKVLLRVTIKIDQRVDLVHFRIEKREGVSIW